MADIKNNDKQRKVEKLVEQGWAYYKQGEYEKMLVSPASSGAPTKQSRGLEGTKFCLSTERRIGPGSGVLSESLENKPEQ